MLSSFKTKLEKLPLKTIIPEQSFQEIEVSSEEQEKRKKWIKQTFLLDIATFPALLGYQTPEIAYKLKKEFQEKLGGKFEFVAGLGLGQGTETKAKQIHHSLLKDKSITVLHGPLANTKELFQTEKKQGTISVLMLYLRDKLARVETNPFKRVKKLFALAKESGIEKLNIHITDAILSKDQDRFLNYVNTLSEKTEIKTCFENIIFSANTPIKKKYENIWRIAYNPVAMYDYFQKKGFDNLQLCIDTAHLKASQTHLKKSKNIFFSTQADELDLMVIGKELERLAEIKEKSINDVLGHIHLVDYFKYGKADDQHYEALVPGQGENLDLKKFVSFLYSIDYQNTITLELAPPDINLNKKELEELRRLNILGKEKNLKLKKISQLAMYSLARWGKQAIGAPSNIKKQKEQVKESLDYIYQALDVN